MSLKIGDYFFISNYEDYLKAITFCKNNGCKSNIHPKSKDDYGSDYRRKFNVVCIRHNKVISINDEATFKYDLAHNSEGPRQFKNDINSKFLASIGKDNQSITTNADIAFYSGVPIMSNLNSLSDVINDNNPHQSVVFVYGKALDTLSNADILEAIKKTQQNKMDLEGMNIDSKNIEKQLTMYDKAIIALTKEYDKRDVV